MAGPGNPVTAIVTLKCGRTAPIGWPELEHGPGCSEPILYARQGAWPLGPGEEVVVVGVMQID